jgi:hypothetical protein
VCCLLRTLVALDIDDILFCWLVHQLQSPLSWQVHHSLVGSCGSLHLVLLAPYFSLLLANTSCRCPGQDRGEAAASTVTKFVISSGGHKKALSKYIASFGTVGDTPALGHAAPCRSYRSLVILDEFREYLPRTVE